MGRRFVKVGAVSQWSIPLFSMGCRFSSANRERENEENATKEECCSEFEGFMFMSESLIENELGIKELPLDASLFHYTKAAGLKGIIDGEVWMSENHFLNDKSEFGVATEVMRELLESKIGESDKCAYVIKRLSDEATRLNSYGDVDEKVAFAADYVMSLCMDSDSALLWSEFANFQGYSIEFNLGELLESFPGHCCHGSVIYSHADQFSLLEQIVIRDYFENDRWPELSDWKSIERLEGENLESFVLLFGADIAIRNMFFKHECFSGEQEYRIVYSAIHDGGRCASDEYDLVNYRVRDELLIPFIKVNIDPVDSIRSVTTGPLNSSDLYLQGVYHILRSKRMKVPVRKSIVPLRY